MKPDHPADFSPRFPGVGRLAEKVALITGGASGIGRAVSLLFAREGAAVAVGYHTDAQAAEDLVCELRHDGAQAMAVWLDAGNRCDCFAAVREVVHRFGRIDVLVCNAAMQTWQEDVTAITEEQAARTLQVNGLGYLWTVQAALPHMPWGGAIVFTTSVNAYHGHAALIDYSASKAAELGLLRALSANLAPKGIRVNGVAPGPIWTPLVRETTPPDLLDGFGKDTPMGRPGQPAEVAPAVLFLACDDASYITGQVIHPNGGMPVGS